MATQSKPERVFPATGKGPMRPCPLCGTTGNHLAVFEAGIEHRFDMPVLPVADYGQALCSKCGLLYVNAPVSDEYLVELYSQENVEWQKQYLSEVSVVWNGGTTDEEWRRFSTLADLVAKIRDIRKVRWMDFGCQTGELGEILQKRYEVQMSGVDVSADYAAQADARWGGHKTARTSLDSFIAEGQKFDVVTAMETLEHIATPWETVASFRKVLTPEGLLVVTVPSAQYFKLKYHVFKAYRSIFNRQRVRESVGSKGRSMFGLCHTHPYNFSPASLELLLKRGGFSTFYIGGIGWSTRFWLPSAIARGIAILTGGRVQIFPSVIAVARISN